MPSESVSLIYIDPPFNTGKLREHKRIKTKAAENGDRIGFKGATYKTVAVSSKSYTDIFDDYLSFLEARLKEARRILTANGSLYFHIDYREAHYCKVLLDKIFGRDCFLNEIIWAYDYGARTTKKWPAKHDNIFLYAKNPENYIFNYEDIERIPYMAPGLVGPEKAARGKGPTDTWWNTIVPTKGAERTGYPTQKPLAIATRIVSASSRPNDIVMDFFAGSGTVGEACRRLGRRFILVDNNPQAIEIMAKRFEGDRNIAWL
jgi:site-specific DNA-methyltransferase (adenine-specific)